MKWTLEKVIRSKMTSRRQGYRCCQMGIRPTRSGATALDAGWMPIRRDPKYPDHKPSLNLAHVRRLGTLRDPWLRFRQPQVRTGLTAESMDAEGS